MKENIFEVLMYLFENYLDIDSEIVPDSDVMRTELIQAGFGQLEVSKAFDWLESLSLQRQITPTTPTTFRIFNDQEIERLDLECRNFLMFLEQTGILTTDYRELAIDRIMALGNEEISLEKLKWIVLMVLLSNEEDEVAFVRMEDLVYENIPSSLH